jgi:hypothetical protein
MLKSLTTSVVAERETAGTATSLKAMELLRGEAAELRSSGGVEPPRVEATNNI